MQSLRRVVTLLVLVSVYASTPTGAQMLPFHTYTTREGLPSNHVTVALQDRRGFLWIGTDNGLSVYDGIEFRNFTTVDGLPNLYITDIIESHNHPGTFWIGTVAGGLIRMRGGRCTTRHVGDNNISSLYEDAEGGVWCSSGGGTWRVTTDSASFVSPGDINGSVIGGLDSNRVVVLTTHEVAICRLDGTISEKRALDLREHEAVRTATVDRDGVVWGISSEGTLLTMRGPTLSYHDLHLPFVPSANIPSHLMDDGQGSLWLTTPYGIAVIDKVTQKFRILSNFSHSTVEPSGPILRDREGTVWIGTYADGLFKFPEQRIYRIPLDPVNAGAYDLVACSDVNGHIWIATNRTLWEVIRLGDNQWRKYPHSYGGGKTERPDASVFMDPNGRLWVGSFEQGPFSCIDVTGHANGPSDLDIIQSLKPEKNIHRGIGITFAVDGSRHAWFPLMLSGVALMNLRDERSVRFFTVGLPSDPVRSLLIDRTGRVWAGSWTEGLAVCDSTEGTFHIVKNYPALHGTGVRSLHEDREGTIWIGTRYGGLVRCRRGEFTTTSVNNGLLSNAIWSIAETQNRMWCGTDVGLETVDKESCRPLTPKAELLGKRVYACGAYKNEFVWCLLANELVVFEQPEQATNTPPPPAYIRSFTVNGVSMSSDTAHEFEHNQNSCTIDFVGINFRDERNVRYQYRMLGHDSTWTKPVKEHTVTFASLRPGAYRFEVRAINGDGAVSVRPATASFVIMPPVWLRWWFMAGAVLVTATIIYALFRYRLYHFMKMERMRLRIAADLHDDVGTNLSSIVLASQVIENELPSSSEPRTHLAELRARAGLTQDMLRDIVWLLNPGNDSGDDFILKLRDIAQRQLMGIPCTFAISGEHRVKGLGLEFKRNVVLFFKEALTNVAKHAGATAVEVDVALKDNHFSLTIRDNGRGFDLQAPTRGNGLANLRTRARNISGSIAIQSTEGRGTTIRLNAKITYTRSVGKGKNEVY